MEPSSPQPQHVLVIDDETSIRNALRRYLEHIGHTVYTAVDGDEALGIVRRHTGLALVLCDIRMPKMTGVELVPQALAENHDLAIIMLTAVDDPRTAIECMKLGASDYLIKPVDFEELGLRIVQSLRRRELEIERRQLEAWLAREVAVRTRELEDGAAHLQDAAVRALGALADRHDRTTGAEPSGHTVAEAARKLGAAAGLTGIDLEEVVTAARLGNIMDVTEVRDGLRAFVNYENVSAFAEPLSDGDREPHLGRQVVTAARLIAASGLPGVEAATFLSEEVIAAARRVFTR